MVDNIDPAAPPSEMQDLDRILEQDFGIEDILDQQVLALSMGMNCALTIVMKCKAFPTVIIYTKLVEPSYPNVPVVLQ